MPLDEVAAVDVEGGLAEGVAVEVLGFYCLHVPSVPWHLTHVLLLFDCLELVVDFFWNVSASKSKYPV